MTMSRTVTRRQLLRGAALGGAALSLGGCLDPVAERGSTLRTILESANGLTYRAQRALLGYHNLAPEFPASAIRQPMRPNGTTYPDTPEYLQLAANNFADYRLAVTGLVDKPLSLSLGELMRMPSRSQITRHDCVEGWSCIAKWTGVPLAHVLDQAIVKPQAKYVVFTCYDALDRTVAGPVTYYESNDLWSARHPQTILAYAMNDAPLPVANGAPLRVRFELQLGYKMPKYLKAIALTDTLTPYGGGQGGFWEDRGYEWWAGI